MVHVSEYKIGKSRREEEKSNVIFRVVCIKCGKSHDQTDVGVFLKEWMCSDCEAAQDYDKFRRRLHEADRG